MTPASVISDVRRLIQDTREPVRYSDTELLGYVNQTLKRMAMLRPDLFIVTGTITVVPNQNRQLIPSNASRLVEIFSNVNGNAIEEVNRDVFDRAYPNWPLDPPGSPTKYIRHTRNPKAFFLYPAPQASFQLMADYVVSPPNYTLLQTIQNPSAEYYPVIVDGTVFLAESTDNEHVSTGRAKLFFDAFVQGLGVSSQARIMTDTESGGLGASPES